MSTSPLVSFGLYNLEINSDSAPACTDAQSFSKVGDLKTGNVVTTPYASFEPSFWLLDGNYKFKPADDAVVHLGLMSLSMSDASGDFATPPVLTITFEQVHTTDGLILTFAQLSNDYADDIDVAYYDQYNNLIITTNYHPDSWEYEIDQDVANFKKIVITFNSTNKPYRYLRLKGINYGQLIYFTTEDIKSVSVIEQIDMTGATLPNNTCELKVQSSSTDFSIIDPSGYYARLSDRQPLSVYEVVNNVQRFMGRYYLETWKALNDTEMQFSCIDAIGVLERVKYYGGLWEYSGIPVEYLINDIMQTASIPFDLDPDLYGTLVMGWLPISNCREALKQVLFAIGAYADTSRSNLVQIRSAHIITGTESVSILTNDDIGESPTVDIKPLVTGIDITTHNYTKGSDTVDLYTGTFTAGTYIIEFSEPAHTLSITGAEIMSSGVNFARIIVRTAGEVVLTGLNYIDNKQGYSLDAQSVGSYVLPNVLQVTGASLVNVYNVEDVAERMMDYCSQRYQQKFKLFAPSVKIGDVVLVDTVNAGQIRGVVEKMSLDLSGGMRVNTEITGVVE